MAKPKSPKNKYEAFTTNSVTPPASKVPDTAETAPVRTEAMKTEASTTETGTTGTSMTATKKNGASKTENRKMGIVKTDARATLVPINLEDEIRSLAYLLSERRGFEAGHEAEDWLTAEREVRQRYHQQRA